MQLVANAKTRICNRLRKSDDEMKARFERKRDLDEWLKLSPEEQKKRIIERKKAYKLQMDAFK